MASWQAHLLNTLTRGFVKPLVRYGSISTMRSSIERLDSSTEDRLPTDIRSEAVSGKSYDGEWVNIKRQSTSKTILYFHGGAFVLRLPVQQKAFVANICRAAKARALIVHYKLAPEVPFPGGLEDCLAAYHDLLEQGEDPSNITLLGDSAGGGLVLSTLIALRDEGTTLPANAVILSPLADLTFSGKSRKFNKYKDPILPSLRASKMHELYMDDAVPEGRYTSPIFANFDGLPPILGQVGSTEILLDDTVRAAKQAKKSGVPFYLEIWKDMPHVFQYISVLPEAQVAIERIAQFVKNGQLEPLPKKYGSSKLPSSSKRYWLSICSSPKRLYKRIRNTSKQT